MSGGMNIGAETILGMVRMADAAIAAVKDLIKAIPDDAREDVRTRIGAAEIALGALEASIGRVKARIRETLVR
jgi:hypothetical protein